MSKLSYSMAVLLIVQAIFPWSGRNQALKDIPDRTWLNVCPYVGATAANGGVSEVPWAYDQNSRVFVRTGGCTGGYTNAIGFFDMGTMVQTTPWTMDITNPSDRPGGGCNSGICYDPITRDIFRVAGASSGPCYGTYGYWRGNMAARTWTHFRDGSSLQQGQAAADTANKVLVFTFFDGAHYMHCTVYDPVNDTLIRCPPKPGTTATEWVYFPIQWWQALEYAPALGGTMYAGYMLKDSARGYAEGWIAWLFNAKTRSWTDLKVTGLESVGQGRPVLSYDPVANVMLLWINGQGLYEYGQFTNRWEKINVTTGPPGNYPNQMFDYDTEHNVHALVCLGSSTGGNVWAFRYANEAGTAARTAPKPREAVSPLSCSPNPFNTSTLIRVAKSSRSLVSLAVYSAAGAKVADLTRAARNSKTEIRWNAGALPSGIYHLRLENTGRVLVRTLTLMK